MGAGGRKCLISSKVSQPNELRGNKRPYVDKVGDKGHLRLSSNFHTTTLNYTHKNQINKVRNNAIIGKFSKIPST